MKNTRTTNIFNIAILTIILVLGMTLSVMANDAEISNESVNTENEEVVETVEETTPAEEVVEVEEKVEEEVVVNEPVVEEEGVLGAASSYDPETGETTVSYPNGEVEVTVEPEEEEEGVLGPASSYDPETGETTVSYPNGEVEVTVEPEEEEEGVLGPASSFDLDTGLITVWYPDGTVEVTPLEQEEATYTSSISQAPSYNDSDNYNAAASVIGASADEPEEVKNVMEEIVEVEEILDPVIEEAVLGDYEEPVKNSIPFTAGLTFFSSTLIGLGVLWKLGIIAL